MPTFKFTSRYTKDFTFRRAPTGVGFDVDFPESVLDFDNKFMESIFKTDQRNQQLVNIFLAAKKYRQYRIKGVKITCQPNKHTSVTRTEPKWCWLMTTSNAENQACSDAVRGASQSDGNAVSYMRDHKRTKWKRVYKKFLKMNFPWCECDGRRFQFQAIKIEQAVLTLDAISNATVQKAIPGVWDIVACDKSPYVWADWYIIKNTTVRDRSRPSTDAVSLYDLGWFNLFRKKRDMNTFLLMEYDPGRASKVDIDARWNTVGLEDLSTAIYTDQAVAKYPRKLFLLPSRNCFIKKLDETFTETHVVRIAFTITVIFEFSDLQKFELDITRPSPRTTTWLNAARTFPFGEGESKNNLEKITSDLEGLITTPQDDIGNAANEDTDSSTLSSLTDSSGDSDTKRNAPVQKKSRRLGPKEIEEKTQRRSARQQRGLKRSTMD